MKGKNLIVITGPTAVGKTAFTINLAKEKGWEILSCDSRQFYREMEIGTAKPSASELAEVQHYFIDSLNIDQDYSAGDFERDGLQFLDDYYKRHDSIIVSGGSGLYIKALCEGLDNFPDVPQSIFDEISALSLQELQNQLKESDPQYYEKVDKSNKHRLIRALSVFKASGKAFSHFQSRSKKNRPFKVIYIVLDRPRKELYERINLRVDTMLENGLIEEARSLHPKRNLNALQTVGYKELFSHFDGETTLDNAIDLIKRNSRRYAKRQLTWFRKLKDVRWMHPDDKIDIEKLWE